MDPAFVLSSGRELNRTRRRVKLYSTLKHIRLSFCVKVNSLTFSLLLTETVWQAWWTFFLWHIFLLVYFRYGILSFWHIYLFFWYTFVTSPCFVFAQKVHAKQTCSAKEANNFVCQWLCGKTIYTKFTWSTGQCQHFAHKNHWICYNDQERKQCSIGIKKDNLVNVLKIQHGKET